MVIVIVICNDTVDVAQVDVIYIVSLCNLMTC